MRIIATLALLSIALPAGAHPILPYKSAVLTGLSVVSDTTTDRNTYDQKAHDDVREWKQRLRDFDATAKTEGKDADQTAKADLNKAWDKAEIASRKLKTSGEEGWNAAKAEYEKASQDLADAWHKVQAEHS
jgi:hypothetical protein